MFKDVLDKIEEADAADAEGNPEEGTETVEAGATETEDPKADDPTEEVTADKLTIEYAEEEEVQPEGDAEAAEGAEGAGTPLVVTDDTPVPDPINGEMTTWGKIKNRQQEGNAEIQRRFQELADKQKAMESKLAEGTATETAEVEEEADPYPFLDDDDPMKAAWIADRKADRAEIAELKQGIEALTSHVQTQSKATTEQYYDSVDADLLEKFPVLDQEELGAAETIYKNRITAGEIEATEVNYRKVVAERAEKLSGLKQEGVKNWKDKHRKPAPEERTGSGVGGHTEVSMKDMSKAFMGDGLRDMIAKEDAEATEGANR